MERTKREAAQKVGNYRQFHLSGDLSTQVAGQVAQGILQFDTPERGSPQNLDLAQSKTKGISPLNISGEQAYVLNTPKLCSPLTSRQYLGHTATDTHGLKTFELPNASTQNSESRSVGHTGGNCGPERTANEGEGIPALVTSSPKGDLNPTQHTQSNYTQIKEFATTPTHPDSATPLPTEGITTDTGKPTQGLTGSMAKELRSELDKQKEITQALQKQVEQAEIRNELEDQKLQQEAWQVALDKIKQAREEQARKHAKKIADLQAMDTSAKGDHNPQMEWVQK